MAIEERRGEIDGLETFWRAAPADGDAPLVYVHGVPTSSDEAVPFLERVGGYAPDLPGFGRSAKLGGFDHSIAGYGDWLEAFVDALGLERFSLMVHDWGAVGLELAMRRPEAVERLVIANAVPLLPGYRWHPLARVWRTPGAGELAMGFTIKPLFRRGLRPATRAPGPAWDALLDGAWRHLDQGTMRAILRLYRSASEPELARAGERLGAIGCPALVVWGEDDPFLPARFGQAYADALGGDARVQLVPDAGHWPWVDRPATADAIAAFLRER